MGLVNRVVPDAEPETYVKGYADTIAANAPLTTKTAKDTAARSSKPELERDLKHFSDLVPGCFKSADYEEGRKAFMEKRKPVFTGT